MSTGRRAQLKCVALVVVLLVLVGACGTPDHEATEERQTTYCIHTGDPAGPGRMWVSLYFPDRHAWYAVPEYRRVPPATGTGPASLAGVALQALAAGTDNASLLGVFPKDARVLGVRMEGTTVAVDMSGAFVANHPGGSTWELMVLRSIVYTLLDIPGVERVQFTVEGRKVETLAGHLALDLPLGRDPILAGPVKLDYDRLELAQKLADQGTENWRALPTTAVCQEARLLGFSGYEEFELLSFDTGVTGSRSPRAIFRASTAAGDEYRLTLLQPVMTGPGGIWTVIAVGEVAGEGSPTGK